MPKDDSMLKIATLAGGCFWCTESDFEKLPGVAKAISGYTGGHKENPTYEEVCTGETGHAEVVRVIYDPNKIGYEQLLKAFWESHDPTQGMRQGNDVGTQYRSALYTLDAGQRRAAEESRRIYQAGLTAAGRAAITTEIRDAPQFFYAEDYHQQYLAKNPGGYCGLEGTGVSCPVGLETRG